MFVKDLLKDKSVLITGGGSGLGKGMATRLMDLGAHIIIAGRRENVLSATARELEDRFERPVDTYVLDVRNPEMVESVMGQMWSVRPPNVLINNAAGNFVARSETLSSRAVDSVLGIVLHGTAYCTLACGKRWIAEKKPGTILNISVTYAWTGAPYVLPSAMAKAGVLALTRSLAVEWGPKGIRILSVAPGLFPTPGAWSRLFPVDGLDSRMEKRPPLGRSGRHEELTNLIAYLVSDQAEYIHGENVTIDGGNWLKRASSMSELDSLTDEDWEDLTRRRLAVKSKVQQEAT
jgi:NAD(P)-dependent dehydrogenase (short-subunit alcohol dehydrogenase family)